MRDELRLDFGLILRRYAFRYDLDTLSLVKILKFRKKSDTTGNSLFINLRN